MVNLKAKKGIQRFFKNNLEKSMTAVTFYEDESRAPLTYWQVEGWEATAGVSWESTFYSVVRGGGLSAQRGRLTNLVLGGCMRRKYSQSQPGVIIMHICWGFLKQRQYI
jgi:hypothetical protein